MCLQHKCKIKDWFPPIFDKTKSFNFKTTMIRKMNMVFGWINFVNSKLGYALKQYNGKISAQPCNAVNRFITP